MSESQTTPSVHPPGGLPDWLDGPLIEGSTEIVRALQAAGHQALIVGGAVRNWLLGEPIKDADVATSAPPETVAALFPEARAVGAHFGVMLVPRRGEWFEVATFRAEGGYVDHRHPSQVRYGTLEEDFKRRDFTINAMYYDPIAGRLVDLAGGRADLERRLLRTVGDPHQRFDEDALRLLRAVRFAVRYELALDPATREALRAAAPTLREISAERIAEELLRMLTGPRPGRVMELMAELGLWPFVIPEIEPMRGCEQPPNFHPEGDVFVHTALVLEKLGESWIPGIVEECGARSAERGDEENAECGMRNAELINSEDPQSDNPRSALRAPHSALPVPLALAGLLHDVGKPPTFMISDRIRFPEHQRVGAEMADEICKRLRLPNRLREQVVELVDNHMRFMDAPKMKTSKLRQFLGMANFDMHLALHRADCLGSHAQLDNYYFCIEKCRELAAQDAQAAVLPPPLAGGQELLALGLKPGPVFKELLDALREEQLEGHIQTREEAAAWLAERGARQVGRYTDFNNRRPLCSCSSSNSSRMML